MIVSGHLSSSGGEIVARHDEVPSRHSQEASWSERYFSHGDQTDVVGNVKSEMHGCVQTVVSEDLSAMETHISAINFKTDEIRRQRFEEINAKEKELIASLLNEQKRLIEKILLQGKGTADQYETEYRRLIEEFVKKLEIQMTRNLDQLQDQLQLNREVIRQVSDDSLQLVINRSQQAKARFQSLLQSSAEAQIDLYFRRRREIQMQKKEEVLGIEQWRKVEVEIYSTAGKIDEKEGCTNIPPRDLFRQQIGQTKAQQPIKRVVYVANRILK